MFIKLFWIAIHAGIGEKEQCEILAENQPVDPELKLRNSDFKQ